VKNVSVATADPGSLNANQGFIRPDFISIYFF
jgi:hypothetical protein